MLFQGKRSFPKKGAKVPPITDSIPFYCASIGNLFVGVFQYSEGAPQARDEARAFSEEEPMLAVYLIMVSL
jgi:hypothetical protein